MTYLKNLLYSVLSTEPPTSGDYIIAKYLMEHVGNLPILSMAQLAKECNLSKATVSRFVRKLGLDDFMDLQYLCRYSINNEDDKFYFHQEGGNVSSAYLDAVGENVSRLKQAIRSDQLERLVTDIGNYPRVAAFGHMQSSCHAMSLQCDLTTCGKYIDFFQQTQLQKDYLKQADEQTLIIIFSVTGDFLRRVTSGRALRWQPERKPKLYLVTTSKIKHGRSAYDEIIELDSEYSYASANISLSLYGHLIALNYHYRQKSTEHR